MCQYGMATNRLITAIAPMEENLPRGRRQQNERTVGTRLKDRIIVVSFCLSKAFI